ncbi:hypothetical protein B296_00034823 [Ensete ventricosum]|uniref:Uncharacterized protein n=1 Tax=Ensete ventricosum TaxID=4639 RepID=A0A427A4Q3_ENSVE|nr:hypothetical protein B296_00034823 [Ensete ventricosum]
MAGKRGWFRKLNKEHRWPWKPSFSASWWWKRPKLRFSLVDDLTFHVLYYLEAVVLVGGFCCFFLCCGCHVMVAAWSRDFAHRVFVGSTVTGAGIEDGFRSGEMSAETSVSLLVWGWKEEELEMHAVSMFVCLLNSITYPDHYS